MSEASPPPESSEKKLHRRPWLIAGGIAIMLLGALAYFFFRDDTPPEDADFKPEWTEGGGPRNPLVIFIEELASFDRKETYRLAAPSMGDKIVDVQSLEDIVTKNAFVFPAFEKLMATDTALWRWPGDRGTSIPFPDNSAICEDITDVALWTKMELLIHQGERQQAARLAVATHKFAQGLLKAEGTSIYYRQVPAIQKTAQVGLMRALEGETSPDFLREVQEALSGKEPRTSDLIQLVKRDRLLMKSTIQGIAHDDVLYAEAFPRQSTHLRIWLRPNRTSWLDLEFRRGLVAALETDWGKAQAHADAMVDALCERREHQWRLLTNPNGFGEYLWREWMWEDLVRDTANHVSNHRMLTASIAIRRYELSRSTLPNTLQDLVPEYLPAVLVDPLNNAPIQWDPAKRELLARGLRRPGVSYIGRSDDGDVVFPLWWKAP